MESLDGAPAGGALAAELRRLRRRAWLSAGLAIIATAVATIWISQKILSSYVADVADAVGRDAKAIAGVVDRGFVELATIPRVLAYSGELHALVRRYNALGERFAGQSAEQRGAELRKDPQVTDINRRLTGIRNNLNYDLVYVLDSHGIRIVSSDWDLPLTLLGVRLDDRDYFKEAISDRQGHMFAVARTTKNPVLFFSAPIEEGPDVIGVVVARQDSDSIGSTLAGGRDLTLIVDNAGMIVASSRRELTLHHVGPLVETTPDPATLREVYASDSLRTLAVERPNRVLHDSEWMLDGRPHLVTRLPLPIGYTLFVLSPLEGLALVQPLHYAIGAMTALFAVLVVLLVSRRAEGAARQRHHDRETAALNEKLVALNRDKDRYLGIAAHDLRNPLSSIRGLSELMVQTSLDPQQQNEMLTTIHRTSDEMLAMVNDLLDVSVIESGKLELRRKNQDLSKLVSRRIRHLEPYAQSKNIALKIDAAEGQHATIDPARFGQVIDNLVSNAIKFSPLGTTVHVGLRVNGSSFALSVQDQGPGIPGDEQKLLFRSFQRLSALPTGGEKSTGLGLAIVKKIVDVHGGRIDVDSAPGRGTRFTVTVPTAPPGGE